MLHYLLPLQDCCLLETFCMFGIPPVDIHEFSLWSLRYVLTVKDVQSRIKFLHDSDNNSTSKRLEYIITELELMIDQYDKYHEQQQHQQQQQPPPLQQPQRHEQRQQTIITDEDAVNNENEGDEEGLIIEESSQYGVKKLRLK